MSKSENRQEMREILFRGFHKNEDGNQKAFVNGKWHKGRWVEGYLAETTICAAGNTYVAPVIYGKPKCVFDGDWYEIMRETVGQFTGLYDSTKWDELTKEEKSEFLYPKGEERRKKSDWKGKPIFVSDIVQYNTFDDFDCQSIVKFGKYKQDGSGGEYSAVECVGYYVEVDNFTCPDWCENDPGCFSRYLQTQNILEVASACKVIGKIYDNIF